MAPYIIGALVLLYTTFVIVKRIKAIKRALDSTKFVYIPIDVLYSIKYNW